MIALALSLFFLGTLARALDRRGAALAACGAARAHHPQPRRGRALRGVRGRRDLADPPPGARTSPVVAAIGVVGVLLTAFWFVPLAVNLGNTTDMRYEPIGSYLDWMFLSENWFLYPLRAGRARRGDLVPPPGDADRRRRITVATGLVFCNWEGLRDIFGKAPAWNLRLLPFWFLMLYLLAGLGHRRARAPPRGRRHLGRPGRPPCPGAGRHRRHRRRCRRRRRRTCGRRSHRTRRPSPRRARSPRSHGDPPS